MSRSHGVNAHISPGWLRATGDVAERRERERARGEAVSGDVWRSGARWLRETYPTAARSFASCSMGGSPLLRAKTAPASFQAAQITGSGLAEYHSQQRWRPQRDSNPCFGLERATSWASGRWGPEGEPWNPTMRPRRPLKRRFRGASGDAAIPTKAAGDRSEIHPTDVLCMPAASRGASG
jgi:hypothetical protein